MLRRTWACEPSNEPKIKIALRAQTSLVEHRGNVDTLGFQNAHSFSNASVAIFLDVRARDPHRSMRNLYSGASGWPISRGNEISKGIWRLVVPYYRVYYLNGEERIDRIEIIEAPSDRIALDMLPATKNGHGIELWDQSRFVGRAQPSQAAIEPKSPLNSVTSAVEQLPDAF